MKYIDIDTAVEVYRAAIAVQLSPGAFKVILEAQEVDLSYPGECRSCANLGLRQDYTICDTCACIGNTGGFHWCPKKGSNNGSNNG
jgi:hypothetical protein